MQKEGSTDDTYQPQYLLQSIYVEPEANTVYSVYIVESVIL